MLHIRPRYYRWHVDPGVAWTERNTRRAHLDWQIPRDQVALVLLDVWDRHYLSDTMERTEQIMHEKLIPLVDVWRTHSLPVIHAPSPPQAKAFVQWVGHEHGTRETPSLRDDEWPPKEFLQRTGAYTAYARPKEPRQEELDKKSAGRSVHPGVLPIDGEAVIATGEEMHQVCKEQGILFLLFTGFNTNACILERDYSLRAMTHRGYETMLVRDCTTAMESYETQSTLGQTEGAILQIEMFLGYTVTSEEIIDGLG